MSRVYGIDLGTTYSCIAYVDQYGKPVVIPNSEDAMTTPSVVYFESPENIVVGQSALEQALIQPTRVVQSVKRDMGKDRRITIDGIDYRPQDVSAYILKKLVRDAETNLGEKIENVVITCPAHFGPAEKEATRQAGQIAGLNVLSLLQEPVAAAICYNMAAKEDETLLVYDLGGGTFDVCLMRYENSGNTFKVIEFSGDSFLGGKNWDTILVDHMTHFFSEAKGVDLATLQEDIEFIQTLNIDAEKIKKSLSNRLIQKQIIRRGADSVTFEITREAFDALTRSELLKTVAFTDQMILNAGQHEIPKITKLLLVGGSTYMPQITQRMRQYEEFEVVQYKPNYAIAEGAAIHALSCNIDQKIKEVVARECKVDIDQVDVSTTDKQIMEKAKQEVARCTGITFHEFEKYERISVSLVTSKSLGLVVLDQARKEIVTNLIIKNDEVPCKVSRTIYTASANQLSVVLQVRESESLLRDKNLDPGETKPLGEVELSFAHPVPQGSPIQVDFNLTSDDRLELYAKDLTTNKEVRAEFKAGSIMQQEEIEASRSRAASISIN